MEEFGEYDYRVMKTLGLDKPLHFSEKAYYDAVGGMENEDGTRGAHYSLEEVKDIIGKQEKGKDFDMGSNNLFDYAFCLNMVYSDYYGSVEDKEENYIKLANAFIFDKDAGDGKALRYWLAMKNIGY